MPPITERQATELLHILDEVKTSLVETTTVMRQHIVEQKGINQDLREIANNLTGRVSALELWQAQLRATLPERLLARDEMDRELAQVVKADEAMSRDFTSLKTDFETKHKSLCEQLTETNETVSKINQQMGKWAAVLGTAIVAGEVVIRVVPWDLLWAKF